MSTPHHQIQVVSLADPQVLAGLHALCFAKPWSPETFAGLLSTPGSLAFVGLLEAEPAGLILLRQAADEAEILTIGVAPSARRHGLARAMVQTAVASLAAATGLFIEVDVQNKGAVEFYRNFGFEQVGERANYYTHADGSNSDAIIMRHRLVSSTSD